VAIIRLIIICASICVVLAGCQSTPEEKIYHILEETVSKEKGFQSQQAPLADLESEETHIFEQMMDLGMKEYEKVVKLSDKALINIKDRKERMKKEQESMLSSQKEFMKIKTEMNEIKNKKLQQEAIELYNLMVNRYKSHEKLYSAYNAGLAADNKLYELLKKKNVQLNELEQQIQSTNKLFSEVMKANKDFNKETKNYNENKLKFYKDAGIESKS
jgi:hypothetical protein